MRYVRPVSAMLVAVFAAQACGDTSTTTPEPDVSQSDATNGTTDVGATTTDGSSPETTGTADAVADEELVADVETETDVEPADSTSRGDAAPADADAPDALPNQSALQITYLRTPDASTTEPSATFEFDAEMAVSFVCSLDGEVDTPCSSPYFVVPPGPGEHVLSVSALGEGDARGPAREFRWTILSLFDSPNVNLRSGADSPDVVAEGSWRGIARIQCDFSHGAYNDPIVRPGLEDGAHLHQFYGNRAVDHATTTATLFQEPESTCQGNALNASSYWVPALLAPRYDGAAQIIDADDDTGWLIVDSLSGGGRTHELFYYSAGIDDLDAIQPVPPGMRIIAGASSTTLDDPPQPSSIARWHCQSWASRDATGGPWSPTIPACAIGDQVRFDIFFPSCWDGENLDSEDHQSHMTYPVTTGAGPSSSTACPDSHPVALMRPSYHYAFPVTPRNAHPVSRDSAGWRLASDDYTVAPDMPGGASLHGDWFNGWHPEILMMLLENCIQAERDCHDGNLGNGFQLSEPEDGTGAQPDIRNQGRGGMDHADH